MSERDNIESLTDPVALVKGLRAMGYSSDEIRRMAKNDLPSVSSQSPSSGQVTVERAPYQPVLETNSNGQVIRADLGVKGLRLGTGSATRNVPQSYVRNWAKK